MSQARGVRGRRHTLTDGILLVTLRKPTELLADELESVRHELVEVTSVVRGAYHSCGALYGVDPRSGHRDVDALFDRPAPDGAYLVFGIGPVCREAL